MAERGTSVAPGHRIKATSPEGGVTTARHLDNSRTSVCACALDCALSELISSQMVFPGRRSFLAMPWAFPLRSFGTFVAETCG